LLSSENKTYRYVVSRQTPESEMVMSTPIDFNAELAGLTMLRNRTPQTTRAERAGSSKAVMPYRDGAVFITKFSGSGGWERHRVGDELVHVFDGAGWRSCRRAFGTGSKCRRASP
jgi:hypothetical protein